MTLTIFTAEEQARIKTLMREVKKTNNKELMQAFDEFKTACFRVLNPKAATVAEMKQKADDAKRRAGEAAEAEERAAKRAKLAAAEAEARALPPVEPPAPGARRPSDAVAASARRPTSVQGVGPATSKAPTPAQSGGASLTAKVESGAAKPAPARRTSDEKLRRRSSDERPAAARVVKKVKAVSSGAPGAAQPMLVKLQPDTSTATTKVGGRRVSPGRTVNALIASHSFHRFFPPAPPIPSSSSSNSVLHSPPPTLSP
jgi:hypothetical protein